MRCIAVALLYTSSFREPLGSWESPTFILITIMKIATACSKPRNDGLFCKPLAFLVVGTPTVITAQL